MIPRSGGNLAVQARAAGEREMTVAQPPAVQVYVLGGFRVVVRGQGVDDHAWRRGYALLARHGLSFDLQTPWWHLDAAAELARDFPNVPINCPDELETQRYLPN